MSLMAGAKKPALDSIVGTLPDWAIKEAIKSGKIKITPSPKDLDEVVDEVTIDFHLGSHLKVFKKQGWETIDTQYTSKEDMEAMMEPVELKPGQPFILTDGEFVI